MELPLLRLAPGEFKPVIIMPTSWDSPIEKLGRSITLLVDRKKYSRRDWTILFWVCYHIYVCHFSKALPDLQYRLPPSITKFRMPSTVHGTQINAFTSLPLAGTSIAVSFPLSLVTRDMSRNRFQHKQQPPPLIFLPTR